MAKTIVIQSKIRLMTKHCLSAFSNSVGQFYSNDTNQKGGLSLYQIMSLYKTHACNVVCRRCDKHRALNLNWTPFYPILSKLKKHFCRAKVFQTVLTF